MDGQDIFNDGEIVHTFPIPEEVRKNSYTKKAWGAKTLADYAAQFFGDRAKWSTNESRSHNGSLTGTKVVINNGDIQTIFMLVEPRGKFRNEVHVSRVVNDLGEGGFMDVMYYKHRGAGRQSEEPIDNPFAALATFKDKLPKKVKNPGAPKKKRFRW